MYDCKKCPGYCCSYPLIALDKRDVERLAKHFGLSFEKGKAKFTVERWGRKPTLVAYLLGTALSALLFGTAGTGIVAFIALALLSFFNLGAWGVVYTYSPELYPTAVRATGAGVAAAVGRIGGIIGPFLTPVIVAIPQIGQTGVFVMFVVLLVITALSVWLLAEETKGRSLEEISGVVPA